MIDMRSHHLYRIVSLDLGSNTGWAALQDDYTYIHGVETFTRAKKVIDVNNDLGSRFWNFHQWLCSWMSSGTDYIYYEKVAAHKGNYAAHMYGAFEGILLMECYENNISVRGVEVGTIKKFITGKGNAKKEEVIEAVREEGFDPIDDNDADAIALMLYAQHTFSH